MEGGLSAEEVSLPEGVSASRCLPRGEGCLPRRKVCLPSEVSNLGVSA